MDSFEKAAECLPDAVSSLLAPGPDHADVFLHSVSQSVIETRSVSRGSRFGVPQRKRHSTKIEGISLRSISGSRVRQRATHELTPSSIKSLSENLTDYANPAEDEDPHLEVAHRVTGPSNLLEVLSEATLDVALSAHPEVASARIHVAEINVRRAIASSGSDSNVLRDRSHRVEVNASISVVGRAFTVVKTDHTDGFSPSELARSIGSELVRRSNDWMQLPRLPAPPSDSDLLVVLPPGWGAVWLHEAIGHQLEADVVFSGKGAFTGRFNQMVGPESITIVDSPTLAGGRVYQSFDDEGTPTSVTVLIDRGRLVGVLTDRYSALRYSLAPTGNARRGHYAQVPRPRMTNLVMSSGDVSAAELKASVELGVEVLEIDHAWFEPESKKVFLHAIESSLIRNGVAEARLEPLIVSGSPGTMLSNIVGIGSDFKLESSRGYCVKSGAAIPVGVGQPTVVLSGLSVSTSRGR